ncbi:class I SAM-dependent methyltransferase [Candidatus Woesearchaeota archaeon]|nr:class I SAM-dependent methyltransferase [Candidatus Woesearchaeota archaeon]
MEHYYSKKQTSSFRPVKMIIRARGRTLDIYTAGGVFSPKKLDMGTALLIDTAVVKPGWRVLDLGCGYGPVGISLKKAHKSIEMVMSDVNSRAVKLTKMNTKVNKVDVEVICCDSFEKIKGKFDTIILNPPQTAGKQLCFQMILDSKEFLNDKGSLQIVARHQKGGKQLCKKMEGVFGNVCEAAKKSGFRVYVSERIENKG